MKNIIFRSFLFIFTVLFTIGFVAPDAIAAKKKKQVNHAQNAYEAGLKAYENEDYQNAVYAFQNSIGYNKKMYKSYYMLGFALFMNNESDAAEESLLNTIDKFPKEWKAQALLAEYYAGKKNYELATLYYQKTIDSPTIKGSEKSAYQEKLNALIKEREEQWRVPEEEKDKIIKQFKTQLDMKKWRAVVIEKRNSNVHVSFIPKEEDFENNAWQTMLDINCQTPALGGFSEINQNMADQLRKQGASMDTIEQGDDTRVFETKLPEKPPVYILGRIFKTSIGYCTAQIMRKKKRFKDDEARELVDKMKLISVTPLQDSAL